MGQRAKRLQSVGNALAKRQQIFGDRRGQRQTEAGGEEERQRQTETETESETGSEADIDSQRQTER